VCVRSFLRGNGAGSISRERKLRVLEKEAPSAARSAFFGLLSRKYCQIGEGKKGATHVRRRLLDIRHACQFHLWLRFLGAGERATPAAGGENPPRPLWRRRKLRSHRPNQSALFRQTLIENIPLTLSLSRWKTLKAAKTTLEEGERPGVDGVESDERGWQEAAQLANSAGRMERKQVAAEERTPKVAEKTVPPSIIQAFFPGPAREGQVAFPRSINARRVHFDELGVNECGGDAPGRVLDRGVFLLLLRPEGDVREEVLMGPGDG